MSSQVQVSECLLDLAHAVSLSVCCNLRPCVENVQRKWNDVKSVSLVAAAVLQELQYKR